MEATRPSSAWDRYAWVAGILFVVALAAEAVVAIGVGVNQDDPAAKIANALHEHRKRLLVIAYLSVVYLCRHVSDLPEQAAQPAARGPKPTAGPWPAGAGWRSAVCGPACRQRRRDHRLARREARVVRVSA